MSVQILHFIMYYMILSTSVIDVKRVKCRFVQEIDKKVTRNVYFRIQMRERKTFNALEVPSGTPHIPRVKYL